MTFSPPISIDSTDSRLFPAFSLQKPFSSTASLQLEVEAAWRRQQELLLDLIRLTQTDLDKPARQKAKGFVEELAKGMET